MHLLSKCCKRTVFPFQVVKALKHILATEAHTIRLQLSNRLHVHVLLDLHLLHDLGTVGHRLLPPMITACAHTIRGTKSSVLQVTELHSSHRLATHVLSAWTGADGLATARTFLCLTHYHLLLSSLSGLLLSLLSLLKLSKEI